MMMIVDAGKIDKSFGQFSDEIRAIGEDIGVQIRVQQEDIFNSMHRI